MPRLSRGSRNHELKLIRSASRVCLMTTTDGSIESYPPRLRKVEPPPPLGKKRRLCCVFSRHDDSPRHGWAWGRRFGASELGALLITHQPVRVLLLQRGSLTSIKFYDRRASCAGECPTHLREDIGALFCLALHVHTSRSCISWPGAS